MKTTDKDFDVVAYVKKHSCKKLSSGDLVTYRGKQLKVISYDCKYDGDYVYKTTPFDDAQSYSLISSFYLCRVEKINCNNIWF